MEEPKNTRFTRYLRGKDSAALMIKENPVFDREDLMSGRTLRKDYLDFLINNYSGDSYGRENYPLYTGGWTTPEVPTVYSDFLERFPHLVQLSFDLGFVCHLPEFMEFAKNSRSNGDYNEVRNSFKEHLGNRELLRGMNLSEDGAHQIKKRGMESSFVRNIGDYDFRSYMENGFISVWMHSILESHFHNENYFSPFVSVTEDPAIIQKIKDKYPAKKGQDFHLFRLRVPELDVVFYRENLIPAPSYVKDREPALLDRRLESYLMFKVNPDEIIEVN